MFEKALTETGFEEAVASNGLKPLEWPVLVAQLAAARELRSALAARRNPMKVSESGTFAHFSTISVAKPADADSQVNENMPHVNPDVLADSKSSVGNVPDIAIETQSGDRE